MDGVEHDSRVSSPKMRRRKGHGSAHSRDDDETQSANSEGRRVRRKSSTRNKPFDTVDQLREVYGGDDVSLGNKNDKKKLKPKKKLRRKRSSLKLKRKGSQEAAQENVSKKTEESACDSSLSDSSELELDFDLDAIGKREKERQATNVRVPVGSDSESSNHQDNLETATSKETSNETVGVSTSFTEKLEISVESDEDYESAADHTSHLRNESNNEAVEQAMSPKEKPDGFYLGAGAEADHGDPPSDMNVQSTTQAADGHQESRKEGPDQETTVENYIERKSDEDNAQDPLQDPLGIPRYTPGPPQYHIPNAKFSTHEDDSDCGECIDYLNRLLLLQFS